MHKPIKWLVAVKGVRSTLTWLLWEGGFHHLSTRYENKVREQGRGETLTAPLYDCVRKEHLSVSHGVSFQVHLFCQYLLEVIKTFMKQGHIKH